MTVEMVVNVKALLRSGVCVCVLLALAHREGAVCLTGQDKYRVAGGNDIWVLSIDVMALLLLAMF